MRLLVLQHIACEHPGVFTEVIAERGVEATAVALDEGEPLPDWREFDAALAMGGPMGAGDDRDHPWLAGERELIAAMVAAGRPVLGVCLGAQLLAAALGGRVMPCERPEVGLLEVELTEEGRADPLFAGLGRALVSLQWHGDTFELPEGAVRLARSADVANQAFRAGERAYGVQFHLEVTAQMAREWAAVPAYADSLSATLGERRGAEFIAEVERRAGELHPPARRLFRNWLELAAVPAGAGA
jgi:GMP synthase-like glutamine amidotransferase